MDSSVILNWVLNILIYEVIFLGVVLGVMYWWYGRKCSGSPMVALIRQSNGAIKDYLVNIEDQGKTIKVGGGTYLLPRDAKDVNYPLSAEEKAKKSSDVEVFGTPPSKRLGDQKGKEYPIRHWVRWPLKPFLGVSFLQRTLRAEIWDEGNPESLRSFYGTINKEGQFVGHLHATASEITSIKNVAEAAGIVGQVEESRELQKIANKALTNQPNKMVVYIGLGAAIVGAIVIIFLIHQLAGLVI